MDTLLNSHKSRQSVHILLGVAMGMFILAFSGLNTRWIVSCSIGLIIVSASMMVKNQKHLFLTLFFLGLPFITMKNIGTPKPMHYGGPAGFYATFYDLPLVVLYLLWIVQSVLSKTAKVRCSKLDFCMLGLIGMSFLSMFNAADIRLCLYELFRIIIMYLIFFYLANNITTKHDLKFIVVPLLIGLFSEGLLGILQFWKDNLFGLELVGEAQQMTTFAGISRVGGTLGHPNSFARYLTFLIPLTISLQFAPIKKRYKVLCALVFLTSITALVLTLSRAAWIGFVVSAIVIFFLNLKTRLLSLPRALSLAALGTIFLITIIISFQGLITTRVFTYDSGAAESRIPLMKVAINMIKTHPFLGVGINNYAEVMESYDKTTEEISRDFTSVVHNSYLFIASEVGVVGLFFLLLFLWVLSKRVVEVLRSNDRFILSLAIGITAGFISLLTQLFVVPDGLVSTSFLFLWSLSAVIMAISNFKENINNLDLYGA